MPLLHIGRRSEKSRNEALVGNSNAYFTRPPCRPSTWRWPPRWRSPVSVSETGLRRGRGRHDSWRTSARRRRSRRLRCRRSACQAGWCLGGASSWGHCGEPARYFNCTNVSFSARRFQTEPLPNNVLYPYLLRGLPETCRNGRELAVLDVQHASLRLSIVHRDWEETDLRRLRC